VSAAARTETNSGSLLMYGLTLIREADAMNAYVAFVEELPGDMKNWFAIPGTVERWVGDDVPGYSARQ
jgi:hypothetical protein